MEFVRAVQNVKSGKIVSLGTSGGEGPPSSRSGIITKSILISSFEWFFLPPATPSSRLGPLKGFLSWHAALQGPSTSPHMLLPELLTKIQGHHQMWRAMHRGPLRSNYQKPWLCSCFHWSKNWEEGEGRASPGPHQTDWVFIPVGVMGSCSGPPSRPFAGRRNRCDAIRRRRRQAWPAMDCDPGTQSVHFGGVLVTRVAREHQSCRHAHPNFRVHQSHVLPILAKHNRRHWGSRGRVSHTAKRGNLRPLQGDSS